MKTSQERADAHITDLRDMGVAEYGVDDLWTRASDVKATYNPALGDSYAVAAAKELDEGGREVALLVGRDDDYDVFEETDGFAHLVERFRGESA